MSQITRSQILPVLEQYLEVCSSADNQRNRQFWTNAGQPWLIERWRGISARRTGAPFTMALDIAGYATVVGIDCPAYYQTAEDQLYGQLRYALWEAANLRCNRFFDGTAFVSFGATLEASLFGATILFPPGQAPWVDLQHPLLRERDLAPLLPFSLTAGGLAPRAHQFYERMCELTEGTGLQVMYPTLLRGPFSVATQLRETTNLLIDMLEAPGFVHELMRRITDGLKEHARQRAEYLGQPVPPAKLFNDEIGTPMLSPAMYDDFVLPYELELAEFHRGVSYWHSCGVTDGFYESVSSIPGLQMMHVGPWSDVSRAAAVFGPRGMALDICVNATEDVYDRTAEEMRVRLWSLRRTCEDKVKYAVRADGFQIARGLEHDLAKIRTWNRAAIEVFGTVPERGAR
jgi:hypothetical protein